MKPYVLLAAGLVLLAGVPAGHVRPWLDRWTIGQPATATAAVYVYEKDAGGVPAAVTVGINRLNRERKVVATLLEDDTTDGTGDVPEQYRPALEAARHAGLPALVALAGGTVLRVTKAPATEADVLGGVP